MENDHADDILGITRDGEHYSYWRNRRVWQLAGNLPVEMVEIASFLPQMAQDALHNPDNTPEAEINVRIMAADLRFPIVISAKGWLFDGSHRIRKAHALGMTHIPAVRFLEDPEPDYKKTKNAQGVLVLD
jgi:hypothetical protein